MSSQSRVPAAALARILPLLTAALLSAACTWVKPTEAGEGVVVGESFNITHCQKLGKTTTSVKHKVGSMDRKADKVRQELVTLARNEAAVMGGDTIVAQGPMADGSMTFDVYACRH